MEILHIVIIAFIIFLLTSMIKIASENERFAVFVMGRYIGLKGPGLVLKLYGSAGTWTKLVVGDTGELIAPGIGHFKDVQLPVQIDKNVKVTSTIRIIGFDSDSIQTMPDTKDRRKIVCEKCGHEMTV